MFPKNCTERICPVVFSCVPFKCYFDQELSQNICSKAIYCLINCLPKVVSTFLLWQGIDPKQSEMQSQLTMNQRLVTVSLPSTAPTRSYCRIIIVKASNCMNEKLCDDKIQGFFFAVACECFSCYLKFSILVCFIIGNSFWERFTDRLFSDYIGHSYYLLMVLISIPIY